MSFEILKPFGPSIVKTVIPNEIIMEMNKFIDDLTKEDEKKFDHGPFLIGNVAQEFRLDIEFMKKIKWAEFLGKSCQKWLLEGHDISIKKFDIIDSWVVKQFKNDYNPIHFHDGQISGVGYLKVPKNMGNTVQNSKKTNHNGKLVLIDGSKRFVCTPTYIITPQVGDFYFFPSYMMHIVYPFSGTIEERRSVSFNAKIDEHAAKLK
ncbi:putative 2OG-Fe(II) oxygenase [Candidatus Pelagibacter sp. HIMB1695]|uniref:putative 2OG-Fe(II) oxygenase n=1 Tax=Candidatus Pelagibacter sp. HIMB1695 TaxID=3413364 RepID=UPI003F83D37E